MIDMREFLNFQMVIKYTARKASALCREVFGLISLSLPTQDYQETLAVSQMTGIRKPKNIVQNTISKLQKR